MVRGLIAAWSWPSGYGRDLAGTAHLNPFSPIYDGSRGIVLGNNSLGSTSPTALQISGPLTIVCLGGRLSGAMSSNSSIFGCSFNAAFSDPFLAYSIGVGANPGQVRIAWNSAGSFQSPTMTSPTLVNNTSYWIAAVIAPGNQALYLNDPVTPGVTGSISNATINYGTNPFFGFYGPGSSTTPAWYHEYGLVYNRALTTPEREWLYRQGRDLFVSARRRVGWTVAMTGVATVNSYPSSLLTMM